jgi:hypothetical protein
MSALPPKADIPQRRLDVRFVPEAVIGALPAPAGGQAVGSNKHSHCSIRRCPSWGRHPEVRCLRARCAADSIASGVNSSRDWTTSAASASAWGSGGYLRLGLAITTIPAAAAARRPFVEL